jgi:hypothetical protein
VRGRLGGEGRRRRRRKISLGQRMKGKRQQAWLRREWDLLDLHQKCKECPFGGRASGAGTK